MTRALNSPYEVSGAAHLPKADGRPNTILRLEGPVPSVETRSVALREELRPFGTADSLGDDESLKLWRGVRDAASLVPGEGAIWRVSLAPTDAPGFLAKVRDALAVEYLLDWGGGLVWLAVRSGDDGGAHVIRATLGGRGHATLVRAPPALRATVPVFEPLSPAVAALTARVKDSFDPKHILNRGRLQSDF
jgi:glycolate oxidase FAD binding subunit